jgi:predicted nucleic acid-binding Zn ribbon protein
MPTYKYKCSVCERIYLEHRDVTHAQSFTHCQNCNAEFVEINE